MSAFALSGKSRSEPSYGVTLLLSAAAAVGLLCTGAYMVYANLQRADHERAWVDHSQTVLANLQLQLQRMDRVDYNVQLFVATGERPSLRAAQTALSMMIVGTEQLQVLVRDNASQSQHARDLEEELSRLTAVMIRMDTDKHVRPDKEILACRNTLGVLQQEERVLLQQHASDSKNSSYFSFLLSLGCFGLALLIVLVLFLLLFRDASRRKSDEAALFAAKETLESTVQQLTERAEESSLLRMASDEMQLCTTAQQAHESVVRHMELLLPGTSGATLMINHSRSMVEIAASWGHVMTLMDGFHPDTCCGLRVGKARWRQKGKSELHCMHFVGTPPENYLCVPLAAHGETLGVLFAMCPTAETLSLAEAKMLLMLELVELASLSIAGLNLRAKLEGQSIRDGLTGLFNRHFMEIALERELHRSARQKTPLAVLMLDVDHFKHLNDTYGHEAGDVVLREVAQCFRKELRDEDIICRYGGEEFVAIMPDADEATALRRAESIRAAVDEIRLHFRGELLGSVTISIGVAMYPETAKEGESLLRLADGALYRAKNGGRNRVEATTNEMAVGMVRHHPR